MNKLVFNETTFEFRNQYNKTEVPTQTNYNIDCIVNGRLRLRLGVFNVDLPRVTDDMKYIPNRVCFRNSQFSTFADIDSDEFGFRNCVEFAQWYFKEENK